MSCSCFGRISAKLTTDGAGAYRSLLDPENPTFYWKNKRKDAEKCVRFAWVNHGKEEFTRVVVGSQVNVIPQKFAGKVYGFATPIRNVPFGYYFLTTTA